MSSNIDKQSFGQAGATLVDVGSGNVEGDFCAIQVIEEAQLTSITWDELVESGSTALADATLGAGMVIYGQIRKLEVASGVILAYKQA